MTVGQIQDVRESFSAIQERAEAVGLLFYGRLFELDPSLRSLFRNDIRAQTKKLMNTLRTIVDNLENLGGMTSVLRHLGSQHQKEFQVKPEHYELLRQAFLWTLAHVLEIRFSPEVRKSWSQALGEVNSIMLGQAQ